MKTNRSKIIAAAVSLALLMWVKPASAQDDRPPLKTYKVGVLVQEDLQTTRPLNKERVKQILKDASKLLQKCNVRFSLNGEVDTFSGVPDTVKEEDIDRVHRVRPGLESDFYVKVVDTIFSFCRFRYMDETFQGCAFPPNFRSIIVVHPDRHTDHESHTIEGEKYPDYRLWAHEFGHLTGLGHRDDKDNALMTPCPLYNQFLKYDRATDSEIGITEDECKCLRFGPGFGPNGTCPLPGVRVEKKLKVCKDLEDSLPDGHRTLNMRAD